MAGIKSPTKGITGFGMLGNQIMFSLLDRVIRGEDEILTVGDIATAFDDSAEDDENPPQEAAS